MAAALGHEGCCGDITDGYVCEGKGGCIYKRVMMGRHARRASKTTSEGFVCFGKKAYMKHEATLRLLRLGDGIIVCRDQQFRALVDTVRARWSRAEISMPSKR